MFHYVFEIIFEPYLLIQCFFVNIENFIYRVTVEFQFNFS